MMQFIFYMGVTDAGLIMAGGAASAFVVLMGWDAQALWERIWPATLSKRFLSLPLPNGELKAKPASNLESPVKICDPGRSDKVRNLS